MQSQEHTTVYRKDYRPYTHSIDSVELDFVLNPESTTVTSTMTVTPLRGAALQSVVNCSPAALERAVGALKQAGHYIVENDTALIRLSVLMPLHKWMRNIEEKDSDLPRDKLSHIMHETMPQ